MLTRDPKVRATTTQILRHPWLKVNGCASDTPLRFEVLTRLTRFSFMNRFKKEAVKVGGELGGEVGGEVGSWRPWAGGGGCRGDWGGAWHCDPGIGWRGRV